MFKAVNKQKAKEVKTITRRDKRRFYHAGAQEAETASARGDQRTQYRILKGLGGAYSGGTEGVIKNDGNKIVKEDEKAQRWREHFQSVLNGRQPNKLHTF